VKILSISDKIISFIYSPQVKTKFGHVDFVVACGDLPYYYQEYIVSAIDKPLFFVRGNHDPEEEIGDLKTRKHPWGGVDLHRRVIHYNGVILAGIEGSLRYKKQGKFMYTQFQMWMHVIRLLPVLIFHRLFHGRYLDVFVTHAPPWHIHDQEDIPHQGIKAFRWLIKVLKPKLHFHGHTHVYRPDAIIKTQMGNTLVINSYGYRETEL